MKLEDIKIGKRYYHAMFGWCTVTHPPAKRTEKVLVELDADEIKYYSMGNGYVTHKRDKTTGRHVLYTPIDDLLIDDKQELTGTLPLKRSALNPTIKFWN